MWERECVRESVCVCERERETECVRESEVPWVWLRSTIHPFFILLLISDIADVAWNLESNGKTKGKSHGLRHRSECYGLAIEHRSRDTLFTHSPIGWATPTHSLIHTHSYARTHTSTHARTHTKH